MVVTFNATISACEKATAWQEALWLLWELPRSRLRANLISFNSALSAAAAKGASAVEAVLLCMERQRLQKDVITFNAAIHSCESRWQRAFIYLQKLLQQDLLPTVVTCTSTVNVCEKADLWRQALLIKNLSSSWTLRPNVMTFNTALSALSNSWIRAHLLFAHLATRQMTPTTITCNALLSSCERAGLWHRALRRLPDLISFNSSISSCSRYGAWAVGLALFAALQLRYLEPNIVTCGSIAAACSACIMWQHALLFIAAADEKRVQLNVVSYNSAMSACEKGAEWQQALALFHDLCRRHLSPDITTCNAAISACDQASQWQAALLLLGLAEATVLQADVFSFTAAIGACSRSRQWQRSLLLLAEAFSRSVQPNALTLSAADPVPFPRGQHWLLRCLQDTLAKDLHG
ncbi:unnamed protein product [Effrenium voratum]|uniref:Pentatricopeptide repeat-containing protein, chloroplastic n=1 Tax=Effrenium voratum TaxID=2562239 RepID=A0AA36ISB7_9DINO|nr:unnamed protein product [Effrenium voratum]